MASLVNQPQGLAKNAIGLREVIFQSVASVGPAATLVSSLPLVMAYAGGAAVTACLLALVTMVLHFGQHHERLDDFLRLKDHMDPDGKFMNDWMRKLFPSCS